MLYAILKQYARGALKIYCPNLVVNHPELLKIKGPVLLACNHPNSFLDGIVLTTIFKHPLYSLARGDAFKIKPIAQLLRFLKLLPIYRSSEGLKNLDSNYNTFNQCQQTFARGHMVLIFSEGLCENEWHLRPLKKGTARLALEAWEKEIPLTVLPVGINYSSFRKFGKILHIQFGQPMPIIAGGSKARKLILFNQELKKGLQQLVYEIKPTEKEKLRSVFFLQPGSYIYFLIPPALVGFLVHAPLFYVSKWMTQISFKNSDHYDSVQTASLMLLYPIYLSLLVVGGYYLVNWYCLLLPVVLPFLAWSTVRIKYKFNF